MKIAQLDEMRCTCGSHGLRLHATLAERSTSIPPAEAAPCRNFCGLKQAPVDRADVDPLCCRECHSSRVLEGAIACDRCHKSWCIAGGIPSFSRRPLSEDLRTGLRVVETDPRSDPRWEIFTLRHPGGLVYHHPGWLEALRLEYNQQSLHLACEDRDGRLLAILPMFYTKGLPFGLGGALAGRRLSSLPRTPLGGPLYQSSAAAAAIVHAAASLVRRSPGIQLQIKTQGHELDDMDTGLIRAAWRDSYALDLPGDPGQLRFGNAVTRHRIKWAVNKAIKLGLEVRAAECEDELHAWYGLYLDVMRRVTVPARSYRFFQSLWRLLRSKGVMELLLAEREEAGQRRLVAGSIFLKYGRTVSYSFTGARREDLALHPNDLLQWHAIHNACRDGYRRYDFGEVPEERQQLADFKSKWGAEPVPLYRYYYPAPARSQSSDAREAGRIQQLMAAAWRRLPLNITGLFGDWIYSHL